MPRDILEIADSMKNLYESIFQENLTELKMHKMLYFAQKKHYEYFGEWLFEDDFEGWVHGPVNRKIRSFYAYFDGSMQVELTPEEEYTVREVVFEYGRYSQWVLRDMSHEESCYKKSRYGLSETDRGNRVISKEDIISDMEPVAE